MKNQMLAFLLFTFLMGHSSSLNELIVYHHYQYHQGAWIGSEELDDEGNYLIPVRYQVMVDDNPCTPALKVMEKLAEQKPGLYLWNFSLDCPVDTTVLYPDVELLDPIIFNEIVASFTSLKDSKYVRIVLKGNDALTFSLDDVDFPYFKLFSPDQIQEELQEGMASKNALTILVFAVGLMVFAIVVVYWRKK